MALIGKVRAMRAAGDRLCVAVMGSAEGAAAVAEWASVANAIEGDLIFAAGGDERAVSPDDQAMVMLDDAKRREAQHLAQIETLQREVKELREKAEAKPRRRQRGPVETPDVEGAEKVEGPKWAEVWPEFPNDAHFALVDRWAGDTGARRVMEALLHAENEGIDRPTLAEATGLDRNSLGRSIMDVEKVLDAFGLGIERMQPMSSDAPLAYRIAAKLKKGDEG